MRHEDGHEDASLASSVESPATDMLRSLPAGRQAAVRVYADQGREAQEEQWIVQNLPLVRHIVNKVASHVSDKLDKAELISSGTLGLVKAAKDFDPSRDVEFRTYAYIRVKGAILDELRSRSVAPPARVAQIKKVKAANDRFYGQHGRPPVEEELAELCEMPLEELRQTLCDGRRQHFLSIHGLSEEGPVLNFCLPRDKSPSPHEEAEKAEMSERLARAIQELPKRDRTVILLYYERDLTMKEAASVLGVTESRVSQLHAAALFKLSAKLGSLE